MGLCKFDWLLPSIVNLYDSLCHNIIEEEVEVQVVDLVGEEHLKGIAVVPVQQQPNGSDCGVCLCIYNMFGPLPNT